MRKTEPTIGLGNYILGMIMKAQSVIKEDTKIINHSSRGNAIVVTSYNFEVSNRSKLVVSAEENQFGFFDVERQLIISKSVLARFDSLPESLRYHLGAHMGEQNSAVICINQKFEIFVQRNVHVINITKE